jgi:uncharacterized protein DUF1559
MIKGYTELAIHRLAIIPVVGYPSRRFLMASQTQFKQQCPSCEAMVPIKDASMVGKKIDCPKCKYRFVVEDPGNVAGEEEAAESKSKVRRKSEDGVTADKPKSKIRRAEGGESGIKKKKKKAEKKSKPTMLFVGIGLGVLAVIGLIVGAIVIFSGGGSSTTKANPGPSVQKPPISNPPVAANPPPQADPANAGGNNNPNGSTPVSAAGANKGPTDRLRAIPSNLLPNESQIVYSVNVHQFMRSTLYGAAFHSASGFKLNTFSDTLGLPLDKMSHFVRAENLKSGWAFNVVQMGTAFSITSDAMKAKLGAQKGPKTPIKGHDYFLVSPNEDLDSLSAIDFTSIISPRELKPKSTTGQMAWHLYDSRTLIVAEVNQLEQFLQSDRQPALLSKLTDEAMASLAGKNGAAGDQNPDGGGTGAKEVSKDRVMRPGGANAAAGANPGGNADADQRLFTDKPTYLTVKAELKQLLDGMEEAHTPVVFSCAGIDLESVNKNLTDTIRSVTNLPSLIPLPTIIAAGLGLQTLSEERLMAVAAIEMRREDDARTLDDALQKNFLVRAANRLGRWMGITIDTGLSDPSSLPSNPFQPPDQGMGNGANGRGRVGPGIRPGASGAGGGGGPSMGVNPGNRGGATPPPGKGTENASAPKSKLTTEFHDKIIFITIDAEINQEGNRKIYQEIESQVVRIKGATEVVAMRHPRLHELAAAANQIRAGKQILQGTFPLKGDASGVVFVSQSPNQRVGWMINLLPQLGHADVFNEIDPKQTWRTDKNLRAGTQWIPEFLDPSYPRDSWTARVPSLPGYDLGATHFTGLSGIGLDSAEWPDDLAHHKKLGMFGYDRPTNFDDVPDGLSNTIFLLETPPTFPRPWIAGGGATVQGVPEKNSIAPFVADHGGKRGTYLLMCDGSVRWASADMPDDLFQALVTRAGSDPVGNLDAAAPKEAAPNEQTPKSKGPTSATSADSGNGASDKK